MSKARGLADLGNAFDDGALSNRNLVINGAMQVAQRGTSAVTINTTSEVFRADRFRFEQGTVTANNGTVEVASDAPTGFKYSTKVTAGSSVSFGSNGFCSLNYRIEGQDVDQLANGTASAQQATLSFWVKSSVTGTYSINIAKYDGSTERFHVKTYTVNSANTWEYKTITFDGDTVASASDWMRLYWQLGGDSGAYNATPNTWVNGSATVRGVSSQANMITTSGATFYLTGVQLEVGDTATPFEHRSYGDELARCQRYFERWDFPVSFDWYVTNSAASAHDVECPYNGAFAVAKRATPTYSRGGTFSVSNLSSNDWTARPTTNTITFYNGASAAGRYFSYNSTSAYLDFDAEL